MKPNLLLAAPALLLLGFSPFQAEEPNVREGNERQATGDPARALPRYDAAERSVGPTPEVDFDRGDALFRLGRTADARKAWALSLSRAKGALGSRAEQNLGTALSAEGDREGAIAAFVESLRQDPKNQDARFGLEVLLRKKQAEEKARKEGGQKTPKPQGAGKEEGGGKEPDQKPSSPSPGGTGGAKPMAPPPPPPAPSPGGESAEAARGAPPPSSGAKDRDTAPMSRKDALRLLDALRSREQALPQNGQVERRARRANGDRDW